MQSKYDSQQYEEQAINQFWEIFDKQKAILAQTEQQYQELCKTYQDHIQEKEIMAKQIAFLEDNYKQLYEVFNDREAALAEYFEVQIGDTNTNHKQLQPNIEVQFKYLQHQNRALTQELAILKRRLAYQSEVMSSQFLQPDSQQNQQQPDINASVAALNDKNEILNAYELIQLKAQELNVELAQKPQQPVIKDNAAENIEAINKLLQFQSQITLFEQQFDLKYQKASLRVQNLQNTVSIKQQYFDLKKKLIEEAKQHETQKQQQTLSLDDLNKLLQSLSNSGGQDSVEDLQRSSYIQHSPQHSSMQRKVDKIEMRASTGCDIQVQRLSNSANQQEMSIQECTMIQQQQMMQRIQQKLNNSKKQLFIQNHQVMIEKQNYVDTIKQQSQQMITSQYYQKMKQNEEKQQQVKVELEQKERKLAEQQKFVEQQQLEQVQQKTEPSQQYLQQWQQFKQQQQDKYQKLSSAHGSPQQQNVSIDSNIQQVQQKPIEQHSKPEDSLNQSQQALDISRLNQQQNEGFEEIILNNQTQYHQPNRKLAVAQPNYQTTAGIQIISQKLPQQSEKIEKQYKDIPVLSVERAKVKQPQIQHPIQQFQSQTIAKQQRPQQPMTISTIIKKIQVPSDAQDDAQKMAEQQRRNEEYIRNIENQRLLREQQQFEQEEKQRLQIELIQQQVMEQNKQKLIELANQSQNKEEQKMQEDNTDRTIQQPRIIPTSPIVSQSDVGVQIRQFVQEQAAPKPQRNIVPTRSSHLRLAQSNNEIDTELRSSTIMDVKLQLEQNEIARDDYQITSQHKESIDQNPKFQYEQNSLLLDNSDLKEEKQKNEDNQEEQNKSVISVEKLEDVPQIEQQQVQEQPEDLKQDIIDLLQKGQQSTTTTEKEDAVFNEQPQEQKQKQPVQMQKLQEQKSIVHQPIARQDQEVFPVSAAESMIPYAKAQSDQENKTDNVLSAEQNENNHEEQETPVQPSSEAKFFKTQRAAYLNRNVESSEIELASQKPTMMKSVSASNFEFMEETIEAVTSIDRSNANQDLNEESESTSQVRNHQKTKKGKRKPSAPDATEMADVSLAVLPPELPPPDLPPIEPPPFTAEAIETNNEESSQSEGKKRRRRKRIGTLVDQSDCSMVQID